MDNNTNSKKLIHTDQGKKWLSQFEPLDQELAITVANSLTLISHSEFRRKLESKLQQLASEIDGSVALYAVREIKKQENNNLYEEKPIPFFEQAIHSDNGNSVNAVDDTADLGSEAIVAQIIRQISKSNPNKYLNHPALEVIRKDKCNSIIFVDDFIGSGRRVRDFLESFRLEPTVVSWLSGKQINFHVVTYSGTEDGIKYVACHKSKPTLHIYRDAPTFDSIYWSLQKKRDVKNLCEKYGRIANKRRKNMWWGYNKGMAAIVFEHGCPNNTPAILWEPNFKGSGWVGLFPNRTVSSATASVFPSEIARGDPIQVLIDAGQSKLARSGALLRRGKMGQIILTALGLIAKGQRKRSTLSFATGLNIESCDHLIEKCIKWQFVTVQRRITPKGLAELNTAKKMKMVEGKPLDIGSDYYYPNQLRETSYD